MYKVKVSKPVTHCMTQSTSEAKSKLKMSNLLNSSMMMRSQVLFKSFFISWTSLALHSQISKYEVHVTVPQIPE